jgi:DinB superfamily
MQLKGELARISDELQRGYDGDCWHGPPLREVLSGVNARMAAHKPPQVAHSIWALVKHLSAWLEVVALRIVERRTITSPDAGDFPPILETSDVAWNASLAELEQRHKRLLDVVAELDPARLNEIVPGKNYPTAVMLHGTSQHYAYHAGQIAVLKKMAESE